MILETFLESRMLGDKLPKVFTLEMRQDDPKKCTSAKLRKLGFARRISKGAIPHSSILLNPAMDSRVVLPSDRETAQRHGIVVIDCSWKNADPIFALRSFKGEHRRLPLLLAGNPTNYSILGVLSSVEALAAALYIMNFKEDARRFLSIYKWGPTFLSLNQDPLDEYTLAETEDQTREIERSYFSQAFLDRASAQQAQT